MGNNQSCAMTDDPPAYDDATSSNGAPHLSPEKKPPTNHDHAMISFSWSDRIRLIRFPEPVPTRVLDVLRAQWPLGVKDTKQYGESLEFKLKGNPFAHGMDDEKIAIRKVVVGILGVLAEEGWGVHPAGGLGRIGNNWASGENDSLIFRRQQPQQYSWMCVSFDARDLLHLVNAPMEVANALIGIFGNKVEKCSQELFTGTIEMKFRDAPWTMSSGKGAVESRVLALDLLQCLESQGFRLCTTLDLDGGKGGSSYTSLGELWLCCR